MNFFLCQNLQSKIKYLDNQLWANQLASFLDQIVDIEKNTLNIDLKDLKSKITKKTKGILIVHVLGNSTNMNELMKIKNKHNLYLIEDTCESLGTKFRNKYLGSFGEFSSFSFYSSHQISSGEGGMILFKDKETYLRAKKLRDHGMSFEKRYWHDVVGFNYRITNFAGKRKT